MRKTLLLIVWLACSVFRLQATVHYVNLHAAGSNDGTSWVNAFTDLQAAMNVAAAGSGDSIFVATATYQPASGMSFYLPGAVKVFGGFVGTETRFNQRNLASKATLLGNGASVIGNYNNPVTGLWDGFIVTGGNASVGGGINNTSTAVTIRNCIISGNTASAGGGIYNYINCAPTIINCVISGNEGSGLYNDYYSSPMVINCTIADNTGDYGGGICNTFHSTCAVINSVIWGNTARSQGNGIFNDKTAASTVTYSDVQVVTVGTGNSSLDPIFVAPGGGTAPFSEGNYRLGAGSPAIDAGSSAANIVGTDLAGNPRVNGSAIDMGAYEVPPATLPVTLIGFAGVLKDAVARLEWKTGLESTLNRFEVRKSIDGAAFATMAVIRPKGSNSSYTYALPQTEQSSYYRLKMVEDNGRIGYSSLVSLKQMAASKLKVYPNPASDYLQVTMPVAGNIAIYKASGVLVRTVQAKAGSTSLAIRSLASGIYFIVAAGQNMKFVKQ